jgi:WD40 repeat protein
MHKTTRSGVDHRSLRAMLRRWRELRVDTDEATFDPHRAKELWLAPPRPYPGLRSFAADEADVFFAREAEIDVLVMRLERSNVIVVLGGSGSGKSSLVRAGLIPRLASGSQVPGRPGSWYPVEIRPGEDPNSEFIRGLCSGLIEPVLAAGEEAGADRDLAVRAIQALLGDDIAPDPAALRVRASEVLRHRLFGTNNVTNLRSAVLDPRSVFALAVDRLAAFDAVLRKGLRVGKPNLLILLDQFEEAFRPGLHTQAVRNLCELLRAVSSHQPPGLFIAATMRSEEMHRATEAGLADVINQSAFYVGPLSSVEEREQIIFAPARSVFDDWLPNWQSQLTLVETAPFSPALVDKLRSESQRVLEGSLHGSDHLPLLQHALLRIWDAAAERWEREIEEDDITLEIGETDLQRASGGAEDVLQACLELYAEEAYRVARAGALNALESQQEGEGSVNRLAFVALCSLAQRDDRNNWARRFTSADRVARLTSPDGNADCVDIRAAGSFFEILHKYGFLNRIQTLPNGRPPAALFDVSHEALIRRWSRLREDVLPRAEQFASDLYEVDQNLNRQAQDTLPTAEITGIVVLHRSSRSLRAKSLGYKAAAVFLRAATHMVAGARSYGRGVTDGWRCAGGSAPLHRRLERVVAWSWGWLNETSEHRAAETVPDRVRGTLAAVLGEDALVPFSFAAALLTEETRHRGRGVWAEAARRDDLLENSIGNIRRMDDPWQLASGLSRRRVARPMKALFALLFLLLWVAVLWNLAERQAHKEGERALIQLLAMEARRTSAEAVGPDGIERAGALALESIALAHDSNRPAEVDAIETVRSTLVQLPLANLAQGSRVRCLTTLPDGRLASGGFDGQVKLWPKSGAGEPLVLRQGSPVRSLTAMADGRLVSGGEDGQIKLWPSDGAGEPTVLHQGSEVVSLAVLADGRLVSGGFDGQIKIWPAIGAGEPIVLQQGNQVVSLAVLPDGRLASGSLDGQIKLWPKAATGEPVVLHQNSVTSLAVLSDGRLASGGGDGEINLWPTDGTGKPTFLHQHGGVLSLTKLADGRLASGGDDGRIRIWSDDGPTESIDLRQGSSVLSLAVLADGRIASGGEDGQIKLWPKDGAGEPVTLRQDGVLCVTGLPDGRIASSGEDGQIKLWPKDGTGEPVVLRQSSPVRSLTALADGRLVSGGEDGQIKLWPTERASEPEILQQGSEVMSFAVLADGRLASGGFDGLIKIWPMVGGADPVILHQGGAVVAMAVLPDGRLASGSFGQIKLWPKDGVGKPLVLHQESGVTALAVLSDGRLASGGFRQIKVWPRDEIGEPLVLQQDSWVTSLAVLADGRLVSGGDDGDIKLWREWTIEPVVLHDASAIRTLAVLPNGRLASDDEKGQIRLWLVDEDNEIAALCLRAGRNLSKDEWAHYVDPDIPWHPNCRGLASNWLTPESASTRR